MFGIGKIIGNVASKMFGSGAGGNLISGVAGGLASFFTGDVFGGIDGALKAFKGLGQGIGNLFGNSAGSKLNPPPKSSVPFNKSLSGSGGAGNTFGISKDAMSYEGKSFQDAAKDIINNKDMSPEDKQLKMMELQQKQQQFQMMISTLSNILKAAQGAMKAMSQAIGQA